MTSAFQRDTSVFASDQPRSRRSQSHERAAELDYPHATGFDHSTTGSDSDQGSFTTSSSSSSSRGPSVDRGRPRRRQVNHGFKTPTTTKTKTMRSISKWTGVQRTQMKHLLSSGKSSESRESSHVVTKDDDDDDELKDPEKQSKKENPVSWRRWAYIVTIGLLIVSVIVVGIVVGYQDVRRREKEDQAFSPALAADHALLVAQGQDMQSRLGGGGGESTATVATTGTIDHSKDEVHEIEEYGTVESHAEDALRSSGSVEVDNDNDGSDLAAAKIAIPISPDETNDETITRPALSGQGKVPIVTASDPALVHESFPELQKLFKGNANFINETNSDSPGLLKKLGLGQTPAFATLGCSDSRVSETLITGSQVGDLFVTRNIGNQYVIDSLSTESVFSYAIAHLGVSHLIVLGHTNCGAVLAAIASESKLEMSDIGENRIMTWIRPIRTLYSTSTRPEIEQFRDSMTKRHKAGGSVTAEDVTSRVWNALIEENVKRQVTQLSRDPSVVKSWTVWGQQQRQDGLVKSSKPSAAATGQAPIELWIHGWVYDVDTGLVHDLGVSVGPRME